MKKDNILVIITGGPGTGKSWAAEKVRKAIPELSQISYDSYKEKNWDLYGFSDKPQKEKVNKLALEEFYLAVRRSMFEGNALLLEYPFYQYHRPRLAELAEEYGYDVVTVYLYAETRTVYKRGVLRDKAGNRHPGHLLNSYTPGETVSDKSESCDGIPSYKVFTDWLAQRDYNLRLGKTIEIDVTDFSKVDYDEIINFIKES